MPHPLNTQITKTDFLRFCADNGLFLSRSNFPPELWIVLFHVLRIVLCLSFNAAFVAALWPSTQIANPVNRGPFV